MAVKFGKGCRGGERVRERERESGRDVCKIRFVLRRKARGEGAKERVRKEDISLFTSCSFFISLVNNTNNEQQPLNYHPHQIINSFFFFGVGPGTFF